MVSSVICPAPTLYANIVPVGPFDWRADLHGNFTGWNNEVVDMPLRVLGGGPWRQAVAGSATTAMPKSRRLIELNCRYSFLTLRGVSIRPALAVCF